MTPFEALYGRSPPRVVDYVAGTTKVDSLDSMLQARNRVLQQLRANISKPNRGCNTKLTNTTRMSLLKSGHLSMSS
ncbi:unnamed protein product [Rhodiola kirilowii]